MSFEDWLESKGYMDGYGTDYQDAYDEGFDEGAKSQQAKIDELQKQVITQGQNFNDQAQKLKDTEYFNQKLQARIDEALRHVVDHGGYDDLTHVINILKGNKDEN